MNVLIIYSHPRRDSLSDALGEAYAEGARAASANVRCLTLAALSFVPHVVEESPREQALEADLQRARDLIRWADHLVFVYPTWWGTVPALLKGFLDRTLTSGFAFREVEGGTGYEGLLTGKSAHLITTMDTPQWVYRWIYRSPGHHAMKQATLQFCGIWPVRISAFGPVRGSVLSERRQWMTAVRHAGARLQGGRLSAGERVRQKAAAWLKAVRLQFYPMTWVAYTAGALGAAPGALSTAPYWLGYLCLFMLEVATVLTNDYFDYESDRQNEYYSMFTGGSRVLVEQALRPREVLGGAALAGVLAGAAGAALLWTAPASAVSSLALIVVLAILAVGYTVPPLQLSHRGLGELDVGITHSLGAILCGYVFQGGAWDDALPWLMSVPLFLSVLPSILLAGIPDYPADKDTGKETLVVKIGPRRAMSLAMVCTALAALAGALWHVAGWAAPAYGPTIYLTLPHAGLLLWMLARYRERFAQPERIDRLIAVALTYIIWHGAVPLANLL